jgi:methylated-DNA-[protein]-cysteine S-methyltransferase
VRCHATTGSPENIDVYSIETPLGWMALAADGERVCGLVFGHDDASAAIRSVERIVSPLKTAQIDTAPAPIRDVVVKLKRFASGESSDFSDVLLDTTHLTPFGELVTQRCREIDWGTTSSYADLARNCGHSGAARAVGNVMRNNRFPLIVPCHRVLASGGGLGGYSAPQGLAMKRRLLAMEQA